MKGASSNTLLDVLIAPLDLAAFTRTVANACLIAAFCSGPAPRDRAPGPASVRDTELVASACALAAVFGYTSGTSAVFLAESRRDRLTGTALVVNALPDIGVISAVTVCKTAVGAVLQ